MADDPLTGAHRPIRRIAAPDVPIPGLLATDGDETVLLVDVDEVDDALWLSGDADHLWGVDDVARRRGGHDAVLPWCSARLSDVLAGRAGDALSGGEAVTIAVSVLRGLRQARAVWGSAGTITGDWWLTDSGRPLVVRGDGGGVEEGASALLESTARVCSDAVVASAVSRLPELITTPQPPDRLDAAERALFEVSAPRPLGTTSPSAPAVFDDLRPQGARRLLFADDPPLIGASTASRATVDRVRDVVRRTAERLRSLSPVGGRGGADRSPRHGPATPAGTGDPVSRSRRGLVVIAGAVALAVLTIGLLWPASPGQTPSVVDAASPKPSVSTSGVDDEASHPEAPLAAGDAVSEPAEIAADLLKRVADCRAADDECAGIVADREVLRRVPAPGPLMLVDDYGGIAVLRAERADGDVLVVIEQRDDRWRVRDAYATS